MPKIRPKRADIKIRMARGIETDQKRNLSVTGWVFCKTATANRKSRTAMKINLPVLGLSCGLAIYQFTGQNRYRLPAKMYPLAIHAHPNHTTSAGGLITD